MFSTDNSERSPAPSSPVPASYMQPVAFAGCFGWFHPPAYEHYGDTVALLCPGLGQDASTGYRSYRQLADRLAAAGYPALRFDYLGTGDSCDPTTEDDVEHWSTWQNSIHHALDWLQTTTGARRVVLFGLRIGAALAAVVAEHRSDIVGLVLLAPVLRGRTYITQLTVEARLHDSARADASAGTDGPAAKSIVLGDLTLSDETQRLVRQLDLSCVRIRHDCRVALYSPVETPVLSACVRAWESLDVDVTCDGFDELEALLRPTHQADEAPADFSGVMAWLQRAVPWSPRTRLVRMLPPPPGSALQPKGCVETVLRFGEGGQLCGILCHPTADMVPGLAVVIANSGGNPHHGFARFSVELARHFARGGVASLRIDFAGLGDSRNSFDNDGPTHVFDVDRTGDMRAALDRLEALGYRRFAAHGLCSGAYHALHAALSEPRFGILLLVNLPWLTMRYDAAGPCSVARRYIDALAQSQTRVLFLFSEGDPGLKQFERHFGAGGKELQSSPFFATEIAPGWDHELSRIDMRRIGGEMMTRFLLQSG